MAFADGGAGGGFAYVPGAVLTTDPDRALAEARRRWGDRVEARRELGPFTELVGADDPVALARELRLLGVVAQPDHVAFAHCGPCCPPHPAATCGSGAGANPVYATPVYATPVYATPVYATPVYATPVYATPVYATPVYATPVYATPVYATPAAPARRTGVRRSSARPAPDGTDTTGAAEAFGVKAPKGAPRVIVLDTGLAGEKPPQALKDAAVAPATAADVDAPDEDGNGFLDPASGHGTFIAGLVQQVAPGTEVVLHRVLSTMGDGAESNIVRCLLDLDVPDPERTVVSLSFGGFALERPFCMEWAIRSLQARGVVVVASAGNDGSCRATYPAAFPDVVSVGAVGPSGPAPFSNYGPWVRACAPGVDLLSTFFQGYDGDEPAGEDGVDNDRYEGWALWSGTSFSAPVVAGALARAMAAEGCTAAGAVKRVVDEPGLMRIPNLGTVVNVL
ncbi:MAG: S8 family peptidase [Acidimicrobiia bacterium]